jgi:hypothetical protein
MTSLESYIQGLLSPDPRNQTLAHELSSPHKNFFMLSTIAACKDTPVKNSAKLPFYLKYVDGLLILVWSFYSMNGVKSLFDTPQARFVPDSSLSIRITNNKAPARKGFWP